MKSLTSRSVRHTVAVALLCIASSQAAAQPAAQWAAQAAPPFGVMVHYLPDRQTIAEVGRFDVEAFAAALAEMRASYLILTLGQNSGQYIAPNATLENLCPGSRRDRPPRDLPWEIGQALQRRGIALVLYLPFRAPQADAMLMRCLDDVSEQQPPPSRFLAHWSAVVRAWSDRYGRLVQGWWFDGTYNTEGMSDADWHTLCSAARSGNPDRWLAFNPGEGPQRFNRRAAPCQDVMAGEFMQPPARPVVPPSDLVFHVLTPLGSWWGRPTAPRFTAAQVRDWIADAKTRGGLFTLDLPLTADFHFLPAHIALVRRATAAGL